MANSMKDFALMMISRNPRVANNPQFKQMIDVIQNGNDEQGQQIAENICKTYGVSKEDALTDAKRFFGIL